MTRQMPDRTINLLRVGHLPLVARDHNTIIAKVTTATPNKKIFNGIRTFAILPMFLVLPDGADTVKKKPPCNSGGSIPVRAFEISGASWRPLRTLLSPGWPSVESLSPFRHDHPGCNCYLVARHQFSARPVESTAGQLACFRVFRQRLREASAPIILRHRQKRRKAQ
jgi:hypothetical protein